jgi:hypothetical protein
MGAPSEVTEEPCTRFCWCRQESPWFGAGFSSAMRWSSDYPVLRFPAVDEGDADAR